MCFLQGALGGVSQVLEQKVTQGQEEIDNLTKQWTAQWDRQKLLLQVCNRLFPKIKIEIILGQVYLINLNFLDLH